MRRFFVFFSSVVLLACLMSFVSCSRDEDATMGVAIDDDAAEYVSMDIAIDDIEIFISEDYYQITPYIVIVLVHGFVPNNCEYPYETRHHWQGNNTAIIEIKTKRVIDDSFNCSANVVAFQIPIYLGEFPRSAAFYGKYEGGKCTVIVNGVKKSFHID